MSGKPDDSKESGHSRLSGAAHRKRKKATLMAESARPTKQTNPTRNVLRSQIRPSTEHLAPLNFGPRSAVVEARTTQPDIP